eukprot:2017465-Amphidinium_carterae.1
MASWGNTLQQAVTHDIARWSSTLQKLRFKVVEPNLTFRIMDLTLPTLLQTRSKLEHQLWQGILAHMRNRPHNEPGTCARLLLTVKRVAKLCGPAASVALMRVLLNVGSNSRHLHPFHCCA